MAPHVNQLAPPRVIPNQQDTKKRPARKEPTVSMLIVSLNHPLNTQSVPGVLLRLALRELEACASTLLSVLLALFLSRITGQVAGSLEHGALGSVELLDGPSDSVPECTRLASHTPTGKSRVDVVSTEAFGFIEGRADHDLKGRTRKVLIHRTTVDSDLAGAESESNSGNSALSLTRGLDRSAAGLQASAQRLKRTRQRGIPPAAGIRAGVRDRRRHEA